MPLATRINREALVIHGGLCRTDGTKVDDGKREDSLLVEALLRRRAKESADQEENMVKVVQAAVEGMETKLSAQLHELKLEMETLKEANRPKEQQSPPAGSGGSRPPSG